MRCGSKDNVNVSDEMLMHISDCLEIVFWKKRAVLWVRSRQLEEYK